MMLSAAHGRVEVRVRVAPSRVLCVVALRSHYPGMVLERVRAVLAAAGETTADTWGLGCDGEPVAWHLPLGVLADMAGGHVLHTTLDREAVGTGGLWLAQAEALWLTRTKEACFVRNGSARAVLALSREDTQAWWTAVVESNAEEAARVRRKVETGMVRVPVKVYVKQNGAWQTVLRPVAPGTTAGQLAAEMGVSGWWLHGVELPKEAPLDEAAVLAYSDGFLHLVAGQTA